MFATEPETVSGVQKRGLALYLQLLPALLPIAVPVGLVYAPAGMLFTALASDLPPLQPNEPLSAEATNLMTWLPLFYLAMFFGYTAVAYRQVMLMRGVPAGLGACVVRGLTLMVPLTISAFGYLALTVAGLFAFLAPGILVAVSMAFFSYVPLMEDRSPWSALYRSHELVWGRHWWRAAVHLVLILAATIIASSLLGLLLLPIEWLADPEDPWATGTLLASFVASWASASLVVPLSTSLFITVYQDLWLRTRPPSVEGADRLEA